MYHQSVDCYLETLRLGETFVWMTMVTIVMMMMMRVINDDAF